MAKETYNIYIFNIFNIENVIPGFYCLDIISNDDYEGSEGSGFIENDEEFEDEEDGANYEGEEGEGEEY